MKRQRYILVTKVTSPEEMRKKEEAKRAAEFVSVKFFVNINKYLIVILNPLARD